MSGASGASSITGSPLPKWQLALAVATPVALGLGYMYYKNTMKPPSNPARGKSKGNSKENGAPAADKQISIDDDYPLKDNESQTLLEKAQKHKDQGNKLFNMGKFDAAIMQYNIAIEMCPKEMTTDLATFYQNRAAAYEQLNKYSAVKADCTKAVELNPKYAKALLRRARAREHCNELELALEDATAACILDKFANKTALSVADRVLTQFGKQQAVEYFANRNLIMPSKYFVKTYITTFYNDPIFSEDQDTDNSDISPGFAKILECIKEQNYDDVIPLCNAEMLSSEPESLPHKMKVLLLRATFYLLIGQHDSAIEDFETIINSDTASKRVKVNALIKRAALFMQLDSPDKSVSDFEMAVQIDPDCGDIYHHRGQVHLFTEKVHEAREDFRKAVELNPNFGVAYVQKCYADYRYELVNRNEDAFNLAAKSFEEAFRRFPDCPECYILYAQILSEVQQYQNADSYFAKALEKEPNNATVYVHRGLLQLQWRGDVQKGVEYIKKAIEIDDKCEYAYETLGTIEVQRGNVSEAIKLFDKALPLGRTLMELTHIFSLRDAAKTHFTLQERLGVDALNLKFP